MSTTMPLETDVPKATPDSTEKYEDQIIVEAISILSRRLFNRQATVHGPHDVRRFLQLKLMPEKRELFAVVFCDRGHRVIEFEVLSHGTLSHATVYPRDVVERALFHNAAALILVHNNPSGRTTPSDDDRRLTDRLKAALQLIDVGILDHIVIGEDPPFSFAENGLL